MKPVTKKLLICIPLGIVFLISAWVAGVCIGELVRNEYMYESFWTREGLIICLVASSIIAAAALTALLYFAIKKRK